MHAGRAIAREQRECQYLQRVAGENGGRLVEGAMRGRLSAPQVIVVHRRQIVVHQRVGMNEFHRRGGRIQDVAGTLQRLSGAVDQQGAQPLAAAQNRVALRRVQSLRHQIGRRKRGIKHGLHACLIATHSRFHRVRIHVVFSRFWVRRA